MKTCWLEKFCKLLCFRVLEKKINYVIPKVLILTACLLWDNKLPECYFKTCHKWCVSGYILIKFCTKNNDIIATRLLESSRSIILADESFLYNEIWCVMICILIRFCLNYFFKIETGLECSGCTRRNKFLNDIIWYVVEYILIYLWYIYITIFLKIIMLNFYNNNDFVVASLLGFLQNVPYEKNWNIKQFPARWYMF